jgi:3-deoxy-D-arabino-heptulosonate 7-phosphate (DAHP) synthase class II
MDPAELVSLIASLNPDNTPGRLAVIVRMGAEKLRLKFPALIEAVEQAGQVRQQGNAFLAWDPTLSVCALGDVLAVAL